MSTLKTDKKEFFKKESAKKSPATKTVEEKITLIKGAALPTQSLSIYAGSDDTGFDVISRSPMLKPALMPLDKAVVGRLKRFIGCVAQPATKSEKEKLGTMAEIVPDGSQVGVVIPLTAVLLNSLQVTGVGEDAESPFVGKIIKIQRLAERIPGKKGQPAHNFIVGVKMDS